MRLNFFSRRRLVRLMAHRWARLLLKAVVVARERERGEERQREVANDTIRYDNDDEADHHQQQRRQLTL